MLGAFALLMLGLALVVGVVWYAQGKKEEWKQNKAIFFFDVGLLFFCVILALTLVHAGTFCLVEGSYVFDCAEVVNVTAVASSLLLVSMVAAGAFFSKRGVA